MISAKRMIDLLADNNVSTQKYAELERGEVMIEEGIEWDVLDELNSRMNKMESELRLLQQPAVSVSWARR